jgi:TonB family protein
MVRDWRFVPGAKNGTAVAVPVTVDLAWGPRKLTTSGLTWARNQLATPKNVEPPFSDSYTPGVQRIRVARAVQTAKLITKVTPLYPEAAKQAGISGSVLLNVVIGTDGRVADVQLLGGLPIFAPAAIAAVKEWVFEPTLVNGRAVEVTTDLEVEFPQ